MLEVHMSFYENLIIFRDGQTFVYTNKIDPLLQCYKDSMVWQYFPGQCGTILYRATADHCTHGNWKGFYLWHMAAFQIQSKKTASTKKWMVIIVYDGKAKLLWNLPQHSVSLNDIAAYHSMLSEKYPRSSWWRNLIHVVIANRKQFRSCLKWLMTKM